jgi:hypothetical protein
MALLPFLTPTLSDEEFHEMYLCCHEINIRRDDFTQRVAEQIIARRKRVARENAELYRRPGNIQLDQCIGDTKMLAAERINLTDWDEWKR